MLPSKVEATVEQIAESLSRRETVTLRVDSGEYEFFPGGDINKQLSQVWTCSGVAYKQDSQDVWDQPLDAKVVIHDPGTANAKVSLEIMS